MDLTCSGCSSATGSVSAGSVLSGESSVVLSVGIVLSFSEGFSVFVVLLPESLPGVSSDGVSASPSLSLPDGSSDTLLLSPLPSLPGVSSDGFLLSASLLLPGVSSDGLLIVSVLSLSVVSFDGCSDGFSGSAVLLFPVVSSDGFWISVFSLSDEFSDGESVPSASACASDSCSFAVVASGSSAFSSTEVICAPESVTFLNSNAFCSSTS